MHREAARIHPGTGRSIVQLGSGLLAYSMEDPSATIVGSKGSHKIKPLKFSQNAAFKFTNGAFFRPRNLLESGLKL